MSGRSGSVLALSLLSLLLNLTTCCSGAVARERPLVWWEGEKPVDTNFAERTGFDARTFEKIRHEVLSEGDWLTNGGKRAQGEPEAFAKYEVRVPADGQYSFWTRKFWKHGPFRWRFDREEWRTCGRDISLADGTYIRLHLGANWVYLGEVELARGPHDFELRLLAEEGQGKTACFDAFLLVQGPFAPRGRLKPGEKSGKAEPGFFAWEPDADQLADDCPIDLRRLNETIAGEKGFVRRDGYDFALGDGTPVKFWMVQGTSLLPMSHNEIDWWARRLAKYGVNMVRVEAKVWDSKQKDPRAIDKKALDRLHYAVSALKKQGIYVYLGHVFWANWSIREDQGFRGYGKGKACHGLLEFSPEMKSVYYSWARALMRSRNPYTGIPLADDPAVAVYEIQNEDSVLFWAFNPDRLPGPTRQMVEERFYGWVVRKHGTVQKAYAAWDGQKHKGDVPPQRRLGLLHPWNLVTDGLRKQPHWKKRAGDQFQFLVETQKDSYDEIVRYLREKLRLKCCIACSNWPRRSARAASWTRWSATPTPPAT